MLDTYGNTNETLRKLAEEASGLRYDCEAAQDILNREDWANHWPVVDEHGTLTGDVVETDDCEDYLNVEDMAMVHVDCVLASQRAYAREHDGYVNL